MLNASHKIDVHAHFVPSTLIQYVRKGLAPQGITLDESTPGTSCLCFDYGLKVRPFFDKLTDLDNRWVEMDRQGISIQILQGWTDIFGYQMPIKSGAAWHRVMNECLLETTTRYPQKLAALVSLPLQNAEQSAKELEYGILEGKAIGAVVAANVCGINLGESALDPVWETAEKLNVPIFIHPDQPIPTIRSKNFRLNAIAHYTYDTTITVGSLVFSGVLDRFPNLKLILAHGGGYFPYQLGRFDRIYRNKEMPTTSEETPSFYVDRFYYDTLLHHSEALKFLAKIVGYDRILLGSDYPFPPADHDPLQSLVNASFTNSQVEQIGYTNITHAFPNYNMQ